MTKEILEEIKRGCKYLIENYEHFQDYEEELKFTDDPEEYDDLDEIQFYFPGEPENIMVPVDKFLRYIDEFPTIKIINRSRIKTKLMTYQIVGTGDYDKDYILRTFNNFSLVLESGIKIDLVEAPFIVGLAAIQLDAYDEDIAGSITPYLAVEIDYQDESKVLSDEVEEELIKSYIFEIADNSGISLKYSELNDFSYDFEEWEAVEGKAVNKLKTIEPYNEGMRLFVSALQINEPELKFLNFYKIIEHFAPVVVNIEGNEFMRKKLDTPQSAFDGDFIRSIFDLARAYEEKFRDEDLIKSTFNVSFDFVAIFKYLPESIKKKVKKQVGFDELTYTTDSNKIAMACNMVGKILYATRNRVVHAKSNFIATGNECDINEMEQLNDFLKFATSQTIRWYNRLPEHQKMAKIK